MPRFARKQTEPIEAVQFTGDLSLELDEMLTAAGGITLALPPENGKHCWDEASMTLRVWNAEERQHIRVPTGHWVIKGLKGEMYPCSEEVFERSYEEIS